MSLYDLESDPGELVNVASEHPDLVKDLIRRSQEFAFAIPEIGEEATEDELTPEDLEQLEKLGYTGDGE